MARVGNQTISKAMFDHWSAVMKPGPASYEPENRAACSQHQLTVEVKALEAKKEPVPPLPQRKIACERKNARALKTRVLNSLISYGWVIGEAAADGLPVSDSEVKRQLEADRTKQFSSEAEFQNYLKSSKQTVADVMLGLRQELASERIRRLIKQRTGGVSQARIADYYNSHKQRFVVPEKRDIEAIRTWTKPAIEKAEREVHSGVSFADVAKRVSIDRPSNEHGGVTLGVTPGQEENGYDEAIFAAKPHVLVGPLHLRKRYYIFEVTKITPGRQKPFAEIEASIAQQLPEELQKQALVNFIKSWREKWVAKTDCAPGYVVQRCKQNKNRRALLAEDPYTLN